MKFDIEIFKTRTLTSLKTIGAKISDKSLYKTIWIWSVKYIVKPVRYPLLVLTLAILIILTPSLVPEISMGFKPSGKTIISKSLNSEGAEKEIKLLEKEIKKLDNKLDRLVPTSDYLIINSTTNKFYLYKGKELIKSDKCSTGSYIMLEQDDKKKWVFKTPKGVFHIQNKIKSPVWKKPDWAFVEEGLPIPSMNHQSRFEYGVLGDYALSLGDGYMIHGTLYQRLLGLPVTHGCIRLDDENLELIFKTLKIGSKVYIF